MKGYLTLIGYLDLDNGAKPTVRLGYVVPTADATQDQRLQNADLPPLTATQLDASQQPLVKDYPLPTHAVHADPFDLEFAFFMGKLPLDAATKFVALSWQGAAVTTLVIPDQPPFIQLTWQPGATVDGKQEITWDAKHPEGVPLEFTVFYSNDGGGSFRQLSQSTGERSFIADFSALPGGKGQIMVMATDGGNTVSATSVGFDVLIKPPLAMVLSPSDQANVNGRFVTFQGQGYYLEENAPELEALTWTSSLDGKLGTGRVVQTPLSKGTHDITLTVGSGQRQGKTSIVVQVE
jgi:hypothetical protein